MSLLAPPALPPVPTAPHTRVQHIFYTAPYIRSLFQSFLEEHPENPLLESDLMVRALSAIYVEGLKRSPHFWAHDGTDSPLDDAEMIASELEVMRQTRGKDRGRRQWDYFTDFVRELTGIRLASRRSQHPFTLKDSEAENLIRSAIAILALKLRDAPLPPPPAPVVPRPKRIAGRLTRGSR